MELWEAKEIERRNLSQVSRLHPQLFETKNFVDGPDFLEKYGIFLSGKKKFPQGYLKLWPQDFIVEEVGLDGELHDIFPDKFMHKKKDFLPEDPVISATLVKCGLSTLEAVKEIGLKMRVHPLKIKDTIKYAGIKDKHAITSQLISVRGINIEKLHSISAKYYFLKNIHSCQKEIFLGGLQANQFTIFIRTTQDFKKDEFEERLKIIEQEGFYNFFYLQRFGIPRLIAPYCGLHLLNGQYEEAVKTSICKAGSREALYFQAIRKEVEKLWGDWESIRSVLESFPITFQVELKMLDYLINNPTNFLGALNEVPDQVWLWADSFSSLLFNKLFYYYIQQKKSIPGSIPILNYKEKSWDLYKELLNQAGVFSLPFVLKNLSPFPFIVRRGGGAVREGIKKIKMIDKKIISEGVILNFILPKGCYATTFLSHLFNLVAGRLPQKFSNLPIDTKANLGQPSLEEILNQFSDVVSTPSWRYLWRIY